MRLRTCSVPVIVLAWMRGWVCLLEQVCLLHGVRTGGLLRGVRTGGVYYKVLEQGVFITRFYYTVLEQGVFITRC